MGTHACCKLGDFRDVVWSAVQRSMRSTAEHPHGLPSQPQYAMCSTVGDKELSLSRLSHTDRTNKTPHGAYQRKRGRGFSTVRADTTLPSYSSSMSNSWCIRTNRKVRATATDETRVGENVKNQPLKTHRQPSEFALLRSKILAKDWRPGTHEGIRCNRAKGIAPSHFTHSNLS